MVGPPQGSNGHQAARLLARTESSWGCAKQGRSCGNGQFRPGLKRAGNGLLTPLVKICKLGTLPQNEVTSLAEVRSRSLRTQQRVTCQCQYPVLGPGLLVDDQETGSQTDSFGRNMSTQLILCQYQNNSFMESLILAQDERWRRA
jgi:hypothetical protein